MTMTESNKLHEFFKKRTKMIRTAVKEHKEKFAKPQFSRQKSGKSVAKHGVYS